MTINPVLKIIKAKKLGVLIRDARQKNGKSLDDCAHSMGITNDDYIAIELGERPPSLPELEILAYHLKIPLEHFRGNEILGSNGYENSFEPEDIKQIRQNAIGGLVRKSRLEANLSAEELGEKAGIAAETLQSYEQGDLAIPLPELETIAQLLNNSIEYYEDKESQVGNWFAEQMNVKEFLSLPKELQDFISMPVNRPYLELAIRLSELKVERLRSLAESLLEITL
jgi:transcriptional regulator with XRE-family HTH domain